MYSRAPSTLMRAAEHTEHTEQTWIYTPRHTRIEDRAVCGPSNGTQRAWVRDTVIPACEAAECIHRHCAHRCVQQSTRNTQNKHGFTRPNSMDRAVRNVKAQSQTRNGTQRACMNGCLPGAEKTTILSLKHTTQNTEPDRGLCPGHLRRSKRCVPHARQRGTGAERREHA